MKVTAQKVEQALQDVPATVEVVSGEQIELRQIDSLEQLGKQLNGVSIGSYTGSQPRIFIRGIGDLTDLKNKRVAVYVDGVPQLDAAMQDVLLGGGVGRVEVLKGPQGTLYGRNALAGVINIVTKRPDDHAISVSAGWGQRHAKRLTFNAQSGVFDDRLRFGLDAGVMEGDGVLKNVANGSQGKLDAYERRNMGFKLEADASVDTQLRLTARHFNDRTPAYTQTVIDPQSLRPIKVRSFAQAGDLNFYEVERNLEGGTRTRGRALTFQISHDFGGVKLNATTAWQRSKQEMRTDADYSADPVFFYNFDPYTNDHRQLSQEVQLVGKHDKLDWQAGLYAYRDQTLNTNRFGNSLGTQYQDTRYQTSGWAGFGQLDYRLAPQWTLVAGVRYQKDRQRFTDVYKNKPEISQQDTSTTYKLAANYEWRPDNVVFLNVATGYTPGGVNTSPQMVNSSPTGPYLTYGHETSRSVELGMKGVLQDPALSYAVSLYQTRIHDQQLMVLPDTQIKNVGRTRYHGLELELGYQFARNWSLSAGYALNRSKVQESYESAAIGKSVPLAPLYTAKLGLQYQGQVAKGTRLTARLDWNRTGRFYANSANSYGQRSYDLVDMSARLDFKQWWLKLNVNNLFNKRYYQMVAPHPFIASMGQAIYGQPRSVMLTAGASF
ncbi:TonB-dependent receptor [Leeia sp. IMCC25680]|uniref:TonB-dependent receptor n=1 Tax=Leeia aquatica TaxID=2725557 RepID=A0A847RXP9_9NEIS|nr:TonB-dependent receptor [Leeia aquatica]